MNEMSLNRRLPQFSWTRRSFLSGLGFGSLAILSRGFADETAFPEPIDTADCRRQQSKFHRLRSLPKTLRSEALNTTGFRPTKKPAEPSCDND